MRPGRPQPHTLAGAYAMDALDGRDAARFERHLSRCQECAGEVRGLREATASLAAAAARRPAGELKRRVLAETAGTRQLPPAHGRTVRPARRAARLAGADGPSGERGRRMPVPPVLRLALVVTVIAVAAAATVWTVGWAGQHRVAGDQPEVAAVLTAPDAIMRGASVTTGGHAVVVMSRRERMLVFAATGLRGLPPSRCYELWLMGPGGARPAGLLPMPRRGMTGPAVASGLKPGDRLGLTVEPEGGSPHPTSAMIIDLVL